MIAVGSETLDGLDPGAVGLDRQHQTGPDALPVDEDGAGAAGSLLAAEVGADEIESAAEEVGQGEAGLDVGVDRSVVDRE